MTDHLAPCCISAGGSSVVGRLKTNFISTYEQVRFPAFKVGKRTLISVEGLREWINKQVEVEQE